MKNYIFKYLFLLVAAFFMSVPIQAVSYISNSVLSSGKWVKIRVSETGIYKLTYAELEKMGLNPSQTRIYGYGGYALPETFENMKYDDLPEIAIYDSGAYILFYAKGVVEWSYENGSFVHTNNPYATYGYYFLTSNSGARKLISPVQPAEPALHNKTTSKFSDYIVYEKELVNYIKSGKEFYGESFGAVTKQSFPFNFPNISTESASVTVDVAASSTTPTSYDVALNGNSLGNISVSPSISNYQKANGNSSTFSFVSGQPENTIQLTFNKSSSSATGNLNYIRFNIRKNLTFVSPSLSFRDPQTVGTGNITRFTISNANTRTVIWDISDAENIKSMNASLSGSSLTFTAKTDVLREFIALDPSGNFPAPTTVGSVTNQNLHALGAQDMIILTHSDFKQYSDSFAAFHRRFDGMAVQVVNVENVYNEFSSGTPDATAYRRFMKMLYDKYPTRRPKYLMLMGRGSYDNRGVISSSGKNNYVLTYQFGSAFNETQSYVCDDYFGFLEDGSGQDLFSDAACLGVGRIPITSSEQAKNVFEKIKRYVKDENKGAWKTKLLFVADDKDSNIHMEQADNLTNKVRQNNKGFNAEKLYLDAYLRVVESNQATYPEVKTRLLNAVNNGVMMINFTGHGGNTGWTDEKILTNTDVLGLRNEKLPIWVTAACGFSTYDNENVSAGENVLLNAVGGGIALFSTTRTVYSNENYQVNDKFIDHVFNPNLRIGDIMREAKNATSASNKSKMSFAIIGDPALKLLFPTTQTETISMKINNQEVTTINALSKVTVSGYVQQANSSEKDQQFNGFIYPTVYDKEQEYQTAGNDNQMPFIYKDRLNLIFSGKASVKNGEFSFTFIVPKDIRYNFDYGRISYYAINSDSTKEAFGYFEEFTVGGSSNSEFSDENPPAITMYLNNETFTSGDIVSENSLFIAHVSDESGINTIGAGIGHDMVIYLDNNAIPIILNDLFEYNLDDYSSGTVQYQLKELAEGEHTLTFRVWDLNNNSTTETITFYVQKSFTNETGTEISYYPNPTSGMLYVSFGNNIIDSGIDYHLLLYDTSGKMVYSDQRNAYTVDGRVNLEVDLSGFPNGLYFLKIHYVESKVKKREKLFKFDTAKIYVRN